MNPQFISAPSSLDILRNQANNSDHFVEIKSCDPHLNRGTHYTYLAKSININIYSCLKTFPVV